MSLPCYVALSRTLLVGACKENSEVAESCASAQLPSLSLPFAIMSSDSAAPAAAASGSALAPLRSSASLERLGPKAATPRATVREEDQAHPVKPTQQQSVTYTMMMRMRDVHADAIDARTRRWQRRRMRGGAAQSNPLLTAFVVARSVG